MKTTLTQQIAELERERDVRRGIFPEWVKMRKLTQQTADFRIACVDDAINRLKELQAKGEQKTLFGS